MSATAVPPLSARAEQVRTQRILGVEFFCGTTDQAIDRMSHGGLLVVPAAPALIELPTNPAYRAALLGADVAITDSAYMVLIWNIISRSRVPRVSGLKYLKELLKRPDVRAPGSTLWIMAGPASARKNIDWLQSQGIALRDQDVYMAPFYGAEIEDSELLARMSARRYRHVIVTVGGGTQERLGLYLKQHLKYLPSIHCIGAAIAFLSGDQVYIPTWGDRFGLGWLFRCISKPKTYVPRYWAARKLIWIMIRYRAHLPPLRPRQ